MSRRASKVDANQAEIVAHLRKHGASVECLHAVGQGVPDLLVGYDNMTFLIEVKDGNKPPSAQKLTPAQVKWHDEWKGHARVVNSKQEALKVIGEKYWIGKYQSMGLGSGSNTKGGAE